MTPVSSLLDIQPFPQPIYTASLPDAYYELPTTPAAMFLLSKWFTATTRGSQRPR